MNPGPQQPFSQGTFAGLTGARTENSQQAGGEPEFDIFEWYPQYQSCQRYFLDHAQHSVPVQALAAFLNIRLPFQRLPHPTHAYSAPGTPSQGAAGRSQPFRVHSPPSPSLPSNADPCVTLIPVRILNPRKSSGVLSVHSLMTCCSTYDALLRLAWISPASYMVFSVMTGLLALALSMSRNGGTTCSRRRAADGPQ